MLTMSNRRGARVERAAAHAAPPARDRRGFTVVEAMIAMMILTFGVLGLAATAGSLSRQMNTSERQMKAASLARLRVERLGGAASCAAIAAPNVTVSGVTSHPDRITERWYVTGGTRVAMVLDSVIVWPLRRPVVIESAVRCS